MKPTIFLFLIAATLLFACKKDEKFLYDEQTDNIYLAYEDEELLTYTFAYSPGVAKDTIWIPVKIAGKRTNQDRKFTIEVLEKGTTATEGFHYEKLKPFYTMPADSGEVKVPLVIINAEGLESNSVYINFQLSGGEGFDTKLPEELRTKRLIFSNRLERPSWWIYWQGELLDYSRVKHQLFLISSGTRDLSNPATDFMETPRSLYHISNTRAMVKYPVNWVETHPESGYVLTKRSDGSQDYDFYHVDAPAQTIQLKYLAASGTYVFIDEAGLQILM